MKKRPEYGASVCNGTPIAWFLTPWNLERTVCSVCGRLLREHENTGSERPE